MLPRHFYTWEQRKFGNDIISIHTGTNLLGRSDNKGLPLIKIGNIKNGEFDLSKLEYLEDDCIPNDEDFVKKGDFLFNTRNTLELVGKGATWFGESDKYAFNSNIARFVLKNIITFFYNYLYNTAHVQKQIRARATGTTSVAAIYPKSLDSIKHFVPSLDEQSKLARYFQILDNLITLHQRKLDKLKNIKKALLEKMFPRNGENIPEVRFKGFSDDWEQRKFKDFTKQTGIRNKENLDLEPYSITNETGFVPQKDAHDEFGYMKNTDRSAYSIVSPNSFAYNPARINVGSIGYYKGDKNVIVSSLYEVFQTDKDIDDSFLWIWFKSSNFFNWINKLQEGSVRQYFYYDKLCECKLPVPSLKEQEKIGTFFSKLDNLITLHQRQYEQLVSLKKYLLSKMFI